MRVVLYVLALLVMAVPSASSLAKVPSSPTLKGQLLVADWHMKDPRFSQTVVYVIAHDSTGAMGLVINKAMGSISFSKFFDRMQMDASVVRDELLVRYGGPVEANRSLLLHSSDMMLKDSLPIADGIAVTADLSMLKAIAEGEGPMHYIFVIGYAGWAPQQLETEIERGDWVVMDGDLDIVFADPEEIWERVTKGRVFSL